MATPQLSPGVLVREVDLTIGRADNVLDNIGVLAGPFPIGPVNYPVDITTEQELIQTFGKPKKEDSQHEYWMTASAYLSYGGVMKIVRVTGDTLNNANAGVGIASDTSLKIDNYDDYQQNHSEDNSFNWAAKNPGSWANNLKVCVIDDFADQRITIASTNPGALGAIVGYGVTAAINVVLPGAGTTAPYNGYIKGIITGINTDATNGNSTLDVKITSRVSYAGTETLIDYAERAPHASIVDLQTMNFVTNAGVTTGTPTTAVEVTDWYEEQRLPLTNAIIYWKSIAPKPKTNKYVLERNGKNDAIHVVVVDDLGTITGNQGTILEKHLSLSKAIDSVSAVNSPQKIWYEQFVADFSSYVYAGGNPSSAADAYWGTEAVATGFYTDQGNSFNDINTADGLWGLEAQDTIFSAFGNVGYTLTGGVDYDTNGGMLCTLGDIITGYDLFSNKDEVQVDYIIMGPGFNNREDSQAKAQYLISIAEQRKDCVTAIGPHKSDLVGLTNTTQQTQNLIKFFSTLSSSSYAIFDSGYKYTYDRFNNKFVYIPTNGDVAGLMCRTNIVAYPWFSPAGQVRGIINNAIKLAYNPNKAQRDQLYPQRINAIVTQPGLGTLLFGDKTALGYASAFDRINVRRLFLTIEQALQKAAEAQLFELNDELTRANFKNIVEPYLRDVQAKRGLYGFLVVCDSTNNTPDVIDNNEFRADIFLKPAKSINYVTLTFVATRTGVAFEEVVGTV